MCEVVRESAAEAGGSIAMRGDDLSLLGDAFSTSANVPVSRVDIAEKMNKGCCGAKVGRFLTEGNQGIISEEERSRI